MTEIADQPPPIPSDAVQITDLVIADLEERRQVGIERYGTPLQPFNGRNSLIDLYQEMQDGLLYIRQRIHEEQAVVSPTAKRLLKDILRTHAETYGLLHHGVVRAVPGTAFAELCALAGIE